jgi:hypothetical protein
VQKSGRNVTTKDVAQARREGATGLEIETVLISAACCMFDRYVEAAQGCTTGRGDAA